MASMNNLIVSRVVSIKQDDAAEWFHCQFCPMSFGMLDEYKTHTFGHFNIRTCTDCNVRLIQICDEWFEVHTVANCRSNNHVHTFNTSNTNNDNAEIVVVKQEPPDEIEPAQLDELLNVKADVDLEDFGETFATNLNNIEMSENNGFGINYSQNSNNNSAFNTTEFDSSNLQFNYQVVNITMKEPKIAKRTTGFKCRFCDKIVNSRSRLDAHIQIHHTTDQTRCKHCRKSFSTFKQLDEHLRYSCAFNHRKRNYARGHPHRPSGPFECDICGSKMKKIRTVEDHMKEVHSTKSSFKCRICLRRYPNRYYLSKHLNRHKQAFENGQGNIVLDDELDKDLIERRKYVRVHPHRPIDQFSCDICGKEFRRYELLEEHMSTIHSAKDAFRCRKCDRVYPNRYYLQKHMARHKNAAANSVEIPEDDLDKGLMARNKYRRAPPGERVGNLTCNVCHKQYKHYYLLMEHMSSRHDGQNIFECKKCGRSYPNRYYLAKHLKRHEEVENSGIPLDQLPYDLDDGLMERTKYERAAPNEEDKTEFDCEECGKVFKRFCLLTDHKRSKHQLGYTCRKCNKVCANRQHLAKHMKKHEQNVDQDIIDTDSDTDLIERRKYKRNHIHHPKSKSFECDSCGMIYKTYDTLKEHMISNHSARESFECRICGRGYPNRYYLSKHLKRHNQIPKKEDSAEKGNDPELEIVREIDEGETSGTMRTETETEHETVMEIEIIKTEEDKVEVEVEVRKEVDMDEDLIKRRKYERVHPHRPDSNFVCDICPMRKVLSSYYSMREHMESKHSRKKVKSKHPCPKCKKLFVSKKRLEKHRNLKHPNVPKKVPTSKVETYKHMCSICGRLFPDKSKLTQHENIHRGIMTECNICGKKFMHKAYLRKHIMGVHSGERPFACEIDGCEWRFSYLPCLKRHQARLHGLVNNPHECPICGKCFPDSSYHLKRHLKAHANNTAIPYDRETKQDLIKQGSKRPKQ